MNELSDARCPFLLYHEGKEVQEMKYLKIFTDFLDVVEPLGDSAAGRLFKAMLRYAMDGTVPVLKGKEGVAWTVARQHMDREAEVYEKKVKHLKRGNVPVTEKKGSVSEQDKDKEKDNDKDKDKDIYILSLRERVPGGEREKYICPPFGGYGCLFVRENPNAHLAKRLGMVYNITFNGEEGPSPDMRQGARQWKKHRRSKTSSRKP